MTDVQTDTARDRARAELAENPGGILEATASRLGLSLQDIIECLPATMWKRVSGGHFIEILQDISEWGQVTVICHTRDVILEFEGAFPAGKLGHGFYNLAGSGGLSGHLRADNCKAILFLRRPFMGTETMSVQFLNADGEAMFKIFVSRDADRRLRTDQVERFAKLEERFSEAGSRH